MKENIKYISVYMNENMKILQCIHAFYLAVFTNQNVSFNKESAYTHIFHLRCSRSLCLRSRCLFK